LGNTQNVSSSACTDLQVEVKNGNTTAHLRPSRRGETRAAAHIAASDNKYIDGYIIIMTALGSFSKKADN
jgi:hypothetical protein